MVVRITGGLGNQMFQYAFAKAMQHDLNIESLQLDIEFFHDNNVHNGFELEKIFHINENYYVSNCLEKMCNKVIVKCAYLLGRQFICMNNRLFEVSFGFFPELKSLNLRKMYMDGYWQSEEYFDSCKDYVRGLFQFPPICDKKNQEVVELINSNNSVSLHVRRGDYLMSSRYVCLGQTAYYQQAIEYARSSLINPVFFIFSDDIEWCKENLKLPEECVFVDWNTGNDSYVDLQLMSLCKHNIIANSSFSWWGAWLNNNEKKIVVAPEKFYKAESNFNDSHLIPKTWKKIKLDLCS